MAVNSPGGQAGPSRNPIQRLKRFLINNAIFPAQDPVNFLRANYPDALPLIQNYTDESLTTFNENNFFGNSLVLSSNDLAILRGVDESEKAQHMRKLILEKKKSVHTKPAPQFSEENEKATKSRLKKQNAVAGFSEFDYASGENFNIIGDKGPIDAFSFEWQGIGKSNIVIVAHFGNLNCYQNHMDELKALAEKHKCRVIGFNARGIGLSEGKIEQSLQEPVDDAKEVLKALTEGNPPVPLDQIVLKGESIGAAILTVAADQFSEETALKNLDKKEREEPFVFNSRSFSRLDLAAVGFVTQNKYIARALAAIVRPIMNALDLNLKPGEAFANLRKDRKDYLVVKDDDVIASIASIHKYKPIKEARKKEKESGSTLEKHKVRATGNESPHNIAFEDLGSHKDGPSGSQRFSTFVDKAKKVEPPPGLPPGLSLLVPQPALIVPSYSNRGSMKKDLRKFEKRMDEAIKAIFKEPNKQGAILDNLRAWLEEIKANKKDEGQTHRIEMNEQDLNELMKIAKAVQANPNNLMIGKIKDELQGSKKPPSIHEVYQTLHQANLIESESTSSNRSRKGSR
jgi:pimeloyl-ACP methyl ester carboxylesterase